MAGVLKTGDVVVLRLEGGTHQTAAVCAVGDDRGVTFATVAVPEGGGWRLNRLRLDRFDVVSLPVFDWAWSSCHHPPGRAAAAEMPPPEVLAGHDRPDNLKSRFQKFCSRVEDPVP